MKKNFSWVSEHNIIFDIDRHIEVYNLTANTNEEDIIDSINDLIAGYDDDIYYTITYEIKQEMFNAVYNRLHGVE